jgi:hypothetical protein
VSVQLLNDRQVALVSAVSAVLLSSMRVWLLAGLSLVMAIVFVLARGPRHVPRHRARGGLVGSAATRGRAGYAARAPLRGTAARARAARVTAPARSVTPGSATQRGVAGPPSIGWSPRAHEARPAGRVAARPEPMSMAGRAGPPRPR